MTDYKQLCAELLHEWDNAPTPSDLVDTDVFGIVRKIRTALKTEEAMTTQQHSITPPPELFKQWEDDILNERDNVDHVLDCAWRDGYRAGADQELDACCEYLTRCAAWEPEDVQEMRDLRRPKPPSFKKQALDALYAIATGADDTREFYQDIETIKTALEQLDD